MTTTNESIVDPNDSGAGYSADYTSLAGWEAGEQRDLTSSDEIEVALCRTYNGDNDTGGQVYITGWTTSATQYIEIKADTGYECEATPDGDGYTVLQQSGGDLIYPREAYVYIKNVRFLSAATPTGNLLVGRDQTEAIYTNCVFAYQDSHSNFEDLDSADSVFKNCVFINTDYILGRSEDEFYNCAVYSDFEANRGIRDSSVYNTVIYFPQGSRFNNFYSCTGDYNAGSDTTAPGANSLDNQTENDLDFVSLTAGSENLHIESTSNLVGEGYAYADALSEDFDGDTWGSPPAIGIDEPSGGSNSPSNSPSSSPSASPSGSPSDSPSSSPSDSPSASPSGSPSDSPSASPSDSPSASPSDSPSASPSGSPSDSPSSSPSGSPSASPSGSALYHGIVTVIFTSKKPTITFTSKKPTITFTGTG